MDASRATVFWARAAIYAARQSTLEEAEGVGGDRRQATATYGFGGGAGGAAATAALAAAALAAGAVFHSPAALAAGGDAVGELEALASSTAADAGSAVADSARPCMELASEGDVAGRASHC